MTQDPNFDPYRIIGDRLNDIDDRLRKLEALPVQRTWVEIEDIFLAAAAAAIQFQNISQRFRHLMVVAMLRSTASADDDPLRLQLNEISTTVYDWMWFDCRHETTTSQPVFGSNQGRDGTSAELVPIVAGNAPGANFSPLEIFIPHYTNMSLRKVWNARAGSARINADEGMFMAFGTGIFKASSGDQNVEDVKLLVDTGPNFEAGSRATLYGLG